MKKTIPRSEEWENIQGFDTVKRKYIRLDCDAWLAAHNIQAEGERRGKKNSPASNEMLPDAIYRKIESWIGKRALDCKQEVGKYINEELFNLHDLSNIWEKENPGIDLDTLVTQRCQDLHANADQSVSDLDKGRAEYEEAARDLVKFRKDHGLSRVADYPDNKVALCLWVLAAGMIESFLSANLLGSVSRGGIIEGWTVALVLTFVNVLLGIGAGLFWRFTNYDWGFRKLFAYALCALCVVVALIWNDVAGHVRDVYVLAETTGVLEAPDEAFATAYRTMIERPLPWESLLSAGLAFVGIAVFVLTMSKMYASDDRFPGYGMRHRKVEVLRGRYQDDLNDALDKLESERKEVIEAISEIKDRYEMDRAGRESALDRLRTVVDDYSMNLRQYNTDLAYLLAAYRDANLAARTAEPPGFFDIESTLDEDVIQAPNFPIPDPPKWGEIPTKANAGLDRVEKTYDELRRRYRMLDRTVEDYAEDTA